MARPRQKTELTVDEVLAEIDGLEGGKTRRRVEFTEQMDAAIRHAFARGVTLRALSAWWKKQGWPGHSENTIRNRMRELGLIQ